ncbi:FadR/GntR family transcriptional regulator [Tianweitania populi]|uniref:FadR/GntR family transcriptional regulator n=1 Tax=Tianweitania populi TaxID=1607949 RepID=UPI00167221EE|nr:FCD domain-containing protein [Tianweitania populi]
MSNAAEPTHKTPEFPHGRSVVNRLVDDIRDLVETRGLQVGDPFPTERELCASLGASRNTVREALVVLRAFGLVETRPKSGAIVADGHAEAVRRLLSFHRGLVSAEGFRDVQGFRRIVETGVGEHIIMHASDADLAALDAVNDRILGLREPDDLVRADYEFHDALVELGGNRTVLATYRMLRPVIEDIMRIGKSVRTVKTDVHATHAELVDSLRQRDRIAYTYLVSRQMNYGLRHLSQQSGSEPERT